MNLDNEPRVLILLGDGDRAHVIVCKAMSVLSRCQLSASFAKLITADSWLLLGF